MSTVSPGAGQQVQVVVIYPTLLGTYGDRGNATVLAKRLEWRGYPSRLTPIAPGDSLPDHGDIYLLGGGSDAAQVSAVRALRADGALHRAADRGAAIFGVGAGYQILGKSFTVGEDDSATEGLGLLDVTTTHAPRRAVGEALVRWLGHDDREEQWLTGFENHAGHTRLGPHVQPLGHVEAGVGNGDGTDGAQHDNVMGSYLHGPALARNPALADRILAIALGISLSALDLPEITELRNQRVAAVRG